MGWYGTIYMSLLPRFSRKGPVEEVVVLLLFFFFMIPLEGKRSTKGPVVKE